MKRYKRLLMTTFLVVMLATVVVSPVVADGDDWISPVECSRVNVDFGQANPAGAQAAHTGVDLGCSVGTMVQAVSGGRVDWVDWWPEDMAPNGHGLTLWIYHGSGADGRPVYSVYAHLSKINVGLGDTVIQGQEVALTGNTGYGTGPHLHFAVARKRPQDGNFVITDWNDPDEYIGSEVVTNRSGMAQTVAGEIPQPVDWRATVKELAPSMQVYGVADTTYPGGIVIHHTVGPSRVAAITYHGGEDRAPYNLIVDEGEFYLTMDFGRRANHAGCANPSSVETCNNLNYFAISVVGDFRYDKLEGEERQALVDAIRWALSQGVPATIRGHQDVGSTECPGPNIQNQLGQLLAEAQTDMIQGPSWVPQSVQQIGRVISLALTFNDLKLKLQDLWWLGWVIASVLFVLLLVGRIGQNPNQTPYQRYWSFGKARWASWTFVAGVVGVTVFLVKGDTRMTFVASYIALGCLIFLLARMRERRVKAGEVTPLLPEGGRILVTKLVTWTLGASGVLLALGGLSGWQVTVPTQAVAPPVVSRWDVPSEMQDLPDFFKTEVANLAPGVERIAREENVPTEVLFVLWLKESGGRRQNPSNGEGLFGFYDLVKTGEYYFQPSLVSDGELLTQLRLAAKEFRRRSVRETASRSLPEIGYGTTNPDVLGWSYVVYNGNILCGGSAVSNWQDHPYVMNGYDSAHTGMWARTSAASPSVCVKLQIIGAWPAHVRVAQLLSAYR